jgi:hypothetical protein
MKDAGGLGDRWAHLALVDSAPGDDHRAAALPCGRAGQHHEGKACEGEPMSRLVLPYLYADKTLLSLQEVAELVEPKDGHVHVREHQPRRLLDEWCPQPDYFFSVRTPRPYDAARGFQAGMPHLLSGTNGDSCLVPCTAGTCRRWVEAALAYATTVDDISAELVAAGHRAGPVPRWRRFAALRNWEKAQKRYERVMREASEAYKPVRREIGQAMGIEKDRAAEHARQTHRRRAELAERPIWGWSMATSGEPAAHVFRHDVIANDCTTPPTSPQMNPPVDLSGLRRALIDLAPVQLRWDSTAITETERELDSMSFEGWWRTLFDEDYRTFTSPPSSHSSRNWGGGTGTGGTGGFTGGFGFGGY